VVGDLEKSATFYKSVCQLSELNRVDATIDGRAISEIMFNATAPGGASFVLLSFLDAPEPSAGEAILGFTTSDIHAFVARARAAGGSVVEEAKDMPEHGVRVAFVNDIEGHLIEVVQML
jgi:predicted enzyme related to lactoylglutathione lyase